MTANQLQFQILSPEFESRWATSRELAELEGVALSDRSIESLLISWNSHGMLSGIQWAPSPTPKETPKETPRESEQAQTLSWAPVAILELINRLKEYFRTGRPLGSLPWEWIDQSGWTPFQFQVYSLIAKIPHGETRTYGWVAARIGKSAATRAVGQALKNNPMPIFIPCHRVVAVDSLGGFMGASDPNQPEMTLKRRLLNLEQSYLNPSFSFMQGLASVS